ncbi:MAG: Ig-like domain-containing protein [Eubacterium sp.]
MTTNRIQGAKVTAYYKETLESEKVLWDASEDSQENPLYSDSEGCYAWDTPEGYWQVVVEKDGYETWASDWLSVPPVQDNINVPLVSKSIPEAEWINVYEEYTEIRFTKYMKPEGLDNVKLLDENNNNIPYTLSYSKNETSEDGVIYANTCKLIYDDVLAKGQRCTVSIPDGLESYSGVPCVGKVYSKIVKNPCVADIIESVSVDYGSQIAIPVKLDSYDDDTEITAVSAFPDLARIIAVEKADSDGIWNVIIEGRMPGETEINISVNGTDIMQKVFVKINMNKTFPGFEDDLHTHSWDNGIISKNATCTQKGEKIFTCSGCNETKTEEIGIDKSAHTFVMIVDQKATCGNEGSQHRECTECGYKETPTVIVATGNHSYSSYVITKAATALATGIKTRTCSECGKKDTAMIAKLIPTIKLNATSITLKVKQSTKKVVVSGLAKGDKIKSWKSSNTKIVKVTNAGKITAQSKTGSATLTVTLYSGKTAKVKVKVQKGEVKTKKISGISKTVTLKVKKKLKLKPVIAPITSVQKITYSSSNKKVATVNSKGVITGKKAGKAKITIKSGTKKFVVTVKVKK